MSWIYIKIILSSVWGICVKSKLFSKIGQIWQGISEKLKWLFFLHYNIFIIYTWNRNKIMQINYKDRVTFDIISATKLSSYSVKLYYLYRLQIDEPWLVCSWFSFWELKTFNKRKNALSSKSLNTITFYPECNADDSDLNILPVW